MSIYSYHLFIHSVDCLDDRSIASSKASSHTVWSSPSSFNFQCPLLFLRSSNSCSRLLPTLCVTSTPPSILFFSIMCFRRQFLRNMWPIQLAFFLLYARFFSLLWLYVILPHFSINRSSWSCPAWYFETFQVFLICCPKYPRFSTIRSKSSTLLVYSCWMLLLSWLSWI